MGLLSLKSKFNTVMTKKHFQVTPHNKFSNMFSLIYLKLLWKFAFLYIITNGITYIWDEQSTTLITVVVGLH